VKPKQIRIALISINGGDSKIISVTGMNMTTEWNSYHRYRSTPKTAGILAEA
jgi:hypothetical protein